ncbi:hypothetical protein FDECE_8466 [Fusarium decemcellulare]|nr:hypothetical protein FDECE_8466 [Fusarium decemcellulare]
MVSSQLLSFRSKRALKHPPSTPARAKRIGQPQLSTDVRHQYQLQPSQDDSSACSFESNDEDSENESCCGDEHDAMKDHVVPESHRFHHTRTALLRLARERTRAFINIARYAAPPNHEQPLHSYAKLPNWQPESTYAGGAADHSDDADSTDGLVVVSPPTGLFHFACPFYASYPQQHRQCLVHHLLTPEQVITHIQRHHMKPPYCPICSETFGTVIDCDNHIIDRSCALSELVIPDGISLYQRARLTEGDAPWLSNLERWGRICATVLPDQAPPPSPYLDRGLGRAVSMARDYWVKHGRRCVSDFLQSQGLLDGVREDDEIAQIALCKLTLEDLLDEMMEEPDYG